MKMKVKLRPLGSFAVDLKERKKVLRAAASEVMAEAKSILRSGSGSGKVYLNSGGAKVKPYLRGAHTASSPGQAPATQTGFLSNQLIARAFKKGTGFAVRDKAYYSAALEKGAHGPGKRTLAPRPYLQTALDKKWSSVSAKIIAALEQGVKYKRDKRTK